MKQTVDLNELRRRLEILQNQKNREDSSQAEQTPEENSEDSIINIKNQQNQNQIRKSDVWRDEKKLESQTKKSQNFQKNDRHLLRASKSKFQNLKITDFHLFTTLGVFYHLTDIKQKNYKKIFILF